MKKLKERYIGVRIPNELYEKIIERVIELTSSQKKLVGISEIIRELIEKEFDHGTKK